MICRPTKSVFSSKTFWFNVLTVVLFMCDNYWNMTGWAVEKQGMLIAVGNLILRLFFTSQRVTVRGSK
jgi:hypothetical protein